MEGVRVGRMTALQKPDGGVRGIVVGDVVRRLVARTLAQQFGPQAESAVWMEVLHYYPSTVLERTTRFRGKL